MLKSEQDSERLRGGEGAAGAAGAPSWSSNSPISTGQNEREPRADGRFVDDEVGQSIETIAVGLDDLDDRYGRLRLTRPGAIRAMKESMERHGQLSPLVATPRSDVLAVVDGFKRLRASRELGVEWLNVRHLELSEQAAVAAVYAFNRVSTGLDILEEALVVQALCREHGLTQVEVGELLGRHRSWVCRRLMLIERLSEEVQNDLRVGLTTMTVAREVARLPRGNQGEMTQAIHRHGLTTRQATRLIGLFEETNDRTGQHYLLEQPREALEVQDREANVPISPDPRLGRDANRLRKHLSRMLSLSATLTGSVEQTRTGEWSDTERRVLSPLVAQSADAVRRLAEVLSETQAVMEQGACNEGS